MTCAVNVKKISYKIAFFLSLQHLAPALCVNITSVSLVGSCCKDVNLIKLTDRLRARAGFNLFHRSALFSCLPSWSSTWKESRLANALDVRSIISTEVFRQEIGRNG